MTKSSNCEIPGGWDVDVVEGTADHHVLSETINRDMMLVPAPPPPLPPSHFPLPLEPSGVETEPPSTRICPLIIEGLGPKKDSVSSLSRLATELQWAEQEPSATPPPPVPSAPVTVKPVVEPPLLATRVAVPTTNTPPFFYSCCATTAPSLSSPTSLLSNIPDPPYKNNLWPGVENSPIFDSIDFNHNRPVKVYRRMGDLRRRPRLKVSSPVPVRQSVILSPPTFLAGYKIPKISVRTRSGLDCPGCGQLWCTEIFCCPGFHSDSMDPAPADPGDLQDQYGLARQSSLGSADLESEAGLTRQSSQASGGRPGQYRGQTPPSMTRPSQKPPSPPLPNPPHAVYSRQLSDNAVYGTRGQPDPASVYGTPDPADPAPTDLHLAPADLHLAPAQLDHTYAAQATKTVSRFEFDFTAAHYIAVRMRMQVARAGGAARDLNRSAARSGGAAGAGRDRHSRDRQHQATPQMREVYGMSLQMWTVP